MMEKQKRVYPAGKTKQCSLRLLLLLLSMVVFLDGVFRRGSGNGFQLEPMPKETAIPLEERFDETLTEIVIELPETVWYALQVGVFESAELAEECAETFQRRGAAGYLWQDGRIRVLASVYPEQGDAQFVRAQLREQHGIDSYLYLLRLPAYKLRIKGMQGQLEILQAALGHFDDTICRLQHMSVVLDRQELSVSEAIEELAGLKTQLDVVSLRIRQRFPIPFNRTVKAVVEGLENYAVFVSSLSAEESLFALGMRLKHQVLSLLWDMKTIYESFGNT